MAKRSNKRKNKRKEKINIDQKEEELPIGMSDNKLFYIIYILYYKLYSIPKLIIIK